MAPHLKKKSLNQSIGNPPQTGGLVNLWLGPMAAMTAMAGSVKI